MSSSGNPLSVIQSRLQVLRAEKEVTESAMEALDREKECIKEILPKLLHELEQTKASIADKNKEMQILDNAMDEITSNYGHVLYSSSLFTGE